MNDKLMIIGASGHGRVIADIAKLNGYTTIEFLDDNDQLVSNGNYKVVGTSKDINQYLDYDFVVAIGNNQIRKRFMEQLFSKVNLPVLIHPSSIIDTTVSIKEGTVVMANAVINANAVIGKGCIINTASTIDHDCFIDDYVHISPGAHLAGTVSIGKETWICTGSNIINNITITDHCVIGAGSTVIDDIQQSGTYVGTPARRIDI